MTGTVWGIVLAAMPYALTTVSGVILAMANRTLAKVSESREAEHKETELRQEAIQEGVKILLYQSLLSGYIKYSERGWCPIYAKKNIEDTYKAYAGLGGDGTGTDMYEKVMDLPTAASEEGG